MEHRILKRLKAEGKIYNPGDIVDTASWAWEKLLREQRKIRPMYEEQANPKPISARREAGARRANKPLPPPRPKVNKAEGQPTAR